METIKILSIDPSLRNSGLSVIHYNKEISPKDPKAFKITNCQVLTNPQKFTGTDAIMNMLDMLNECAKKECYQDVDNVLVESPPIMFNKNWGAGTISSIAHISGGAVALFGIEKSYLFRPNEWNKSRKKEVTHNQTLMFLGEHTTWHFEKVLKSEKLLEHVLDAVSMGIWWIKNNYMEE